MTEYLPYIYGLLVLGALSSSLNVILQWVDIIHRYDPKDDTAHLLNQITWLESRIEYLEEELITKAFNETNQSNS